MAERLGLGVIPGVGWRASEIRIIAREAEDAGFEAVVTTEANNDSLATAQVMGDATHRINVGTWVSSIHIRHSYACANAASLIADATGGRMILGLGVSHQPVNAALGADMPTPTLALRRYATEVAGWLRGEGPPTHLPQEPARVPVPLYLAAMTSPMVELAGELADGVMPFMWSAARVRGARYGRLVGARRRWLADRWTWRSEFQRLSAKKSRRSAAPPVRTLHCSRPSHSFIGCFGQAASWKRPRRPRRVRAEIR